ncbi:MAG: hypothetical protein MIO93_06615 [ANME-2 cluster archaeon]|nr:hypothetical protein [ANME-2 cluster archaeon]
MTRKKATSVAFDVDILTRIETVRGRISRSAFINDTLDKMLTAEEQRLRIA